MARALVALWPFSLLLTSSFALEKILSSLQSGAEIFSMRFDDEKWMSAALEEARRCLRPEPLRCDVPVGAVCVYQGRIIGRGHNRREEWADPTAHAEVLALREAARTLGTSHLSDVTLYSTLEPCPMCAGALWLARVERIVFGAWDERAGACGSIFDIPRDARLNHNPQLRGGVRKDECLSLLQDFFCTRRSEAEAQKRSAPK